MEFASVEIKTECEKCGNPVMLNGPVRTLHCPSCQHEKEILPMTWKSILGDVIDETKDLKPGEGYQSQVIAGDFNRDMTIFKEDPVCSSCGNSLNNFPEKVSGVVNFQCPHCSSENMLSEAPAWLSSMVPEIVLIVNGQTVQADGKKEEPGGKPVYFTCPACSGNLTVDGTSRLVTCKYCSGDIYLPDDLWLRMHPVKTVKKWYIGFMKNDASLKQKKLNSDLLEAAYDTDDDRGIELLSQGADPGASDHDNRTALFMAAATDARKLAKALIEKGAAPDVQDSYGTTALNIASYNGNADIVKNLLAAGADSNIVNKVGVTALNAAAKMGHASIVKMLLEHGADPSIANEDGKRPVDRAREKGNNDIVKLLEKL